VRASHPIVLAIKVFLSATSRERPIDIRRRCRRDVVEPRIVIVVVIIHRPERARRHGVSTRATLGNASLSAARDG
jgi:hypothetical protein